MSSFRPTALHPESNAAPLRPSSPPARGLPQGVGSPPRPGGTTERPGGGTGGNSQGHPRGMGGWRWVGDASLHTPEGLQVNPSPASVSPLGWRVLGGHGWGDPGTRRCAEVAEAGGPGADELGFGHGLIAGRRRCGGGGRRRAVFAEDKVYGTGGGRAGGAATLPLPRWHPGCRRPWEWGSRGAAGTRRVTGTVGPGGGPRGPRGYGDRGQHRGWGERGTSGTRGAMGTTGAGHPPAARAVTLPSDTGRRMGSALGTAMPRGPSSPEYPHPLGTPMPGVPPSPGYPHPLGTPIPSLSPSPGHYRALRAAAP